MKKYLCLLSVVLFTFSAQAVAATQQYTYPPIPGVGVPAGIPAGLPAPAAVPGSQPAMMMPMQGRGIPMVAYPNPAMRTMPAMPYQAPAPSAYPMMSAPPMQMPQRMPGNYPPLMNPGMPLSQGMGMPAPAMKPMAVYPNPSMQPPPASANRSVYPPMNPTQAANPYQGLPGGTPGPYRPPPPKPKKPTKPWGDTRYIWPDFYTDFTSDAWDTMINAPYEMGYMPGGWRFPSFSSPDPVTVGDAVANQVPPVLEEIPNFIDFTN